MKSLIRQRRVVTLHFIVLRVVYLLSWECNPVQASYGGEDAFFISQERSTAFGVADGVGGWVKSGINPAGLIFFSISASSWPCSLMKPVVHLSGNHYHSVVPQPWLCPDKSPPKPAGSDLV